MSRKFQKDLSVEMAPLNEEAILFLPIKNSFFVLNRTSSFLWSKLTNPSTIEELAEEICHSFDGVTPDDALRDVQKTVDQMVSLELIVAKD